MSNRNKIIGIVIAVVMVVLIYAIVRFGSAPTETPSNQANPANPSQNAPGASGEGTPGSAQQQQAPGQTGQPGQPSQTGGGATSQTGAGNQPGQTQLPGQQSKPGAPGVVPAPGQKGAEAPKPAPVVYGCFTETFHHKSLASHADGEACLHHKNLIKISQDKVNPTSLCVRVNGTPVKFTSMLKQSNSVMIDPIAGPDAEIAVRFCTGKVTCAEPCKVPKDEFLAAIGGDDDEDAPKKAKKGKRGGNWAADSDGSAPDKDEAALNTEMTQLNKDLKNEGGKYSIFKDWIQQQEVAACKDKTQGGR